MLENIILPRAPDVVAAAQAIMQKELTNMIQGFWHVSFTVRDLDASVKWYTKVLGLEYVRGQVQHNEYTSKLVAFPDAHLKVAQLRVPGQTIPLSRHHIELIEYVSPRGEDIP